mgnify:CR=1 FL=1
MGGVPSGGSTIKNILIGVFTTVVAYLIVHFILDKKKGNDDLEKTYQATENAFRSINDYVNLADLKFKTIACFSCDKSQMKQEMTRELTQLSSNLKKIAENTAVDEKMRTIAELTMQQFEEEKPLYQNYFDSLQVIDQLPEAEKMAASTNLVESFMKRIQYLQNRDVDDIKALRDKLLEKYKKYTKENSFVFVPNEVVFDEEALTRKWRIECVYFLDIKADNTVIFLGPETEINGKWKLQGKELYLSLNNGEELHYTIEELSNKVMQLKYDGSPVASVACPN